jgi:hypothetical protein
MPRGRCAFRQRDITRALRAARAAEMEVKVVIRATDGSIEIIPIKTEELPVSMPEATHAAEWDGVTEVA